MSGYRKFQNRDKELDNNHYDFVVIGSGIAGATCASILGRYGKRVIVLEQHPDTAGGCLHSFPIEGSKSTFCSGMHYINVAGSPLMRAVFADITDNIPLQRSRPGQIIDIYPGVGSFCPNNFEDVMGIRKKEFKRLMSYTYFLLGIKLVNSFVARIIYFIYTFFGYKDEMCMNFFDWANKVEFNHPANADKIRFIAAGDHSMHRDDCPAVIQAAILSHYCSGITKPEGWAPNMVTRICKKINERGGAVHNNAPVKELIIDDASGGRAVGVVTQDGTRITVKEGVVCAGGTHLLARLSPNVVGKELKKALAMGVSAKHGSAFLVYKNKTPKDLKLPDDEANVWVDEKYFISHKYDSANNSTIVYVLGESEYFERGPDYLDNKEQYTDALMKMATEHFPLLKDYDVMDSATPASTEQWLASEKGCSYGLSQPAERFGDYEIIRSLRPTTAVPGLFKSDQDNLIHGICGAMMAGAITAQAILTPSPLLQLLPVIGSGPNVFKDLLIDLGKLNKQKENDNNNKKKE